MATTMRPRPTTYKGVQMRSRLEAGFARWLDHMKTPWTYEPRAFTAIDGWQYLPGSATEMMPVGVSPGVADEDVGLGFYLAWNERPWIGEWWKGGA